MSIMCVYRIRNKLTNDLYIGSAINFTKRKAIHKRLLRRNVHHSRYLQNAFNVYKEDGFIFEIVELIADINTLLNREQYWIDILHPAYNTMKDIKSHIGIKRSEETKHKMSLSQTGKKHSKETIQKLRDIFTGKIQSTETKIKRAKKAYKSIIQINRNTNEVVKMWESATIASTTLGISRGAIYESANHRKQPFKDYIWEFKK